MTATRVCPVCRVEKPATREHFYSYGYLSGAALRSSCRPCYIAAQTAARKARKARQEREKAAT